MKAAQRTRLVDVAAGREPADLLVRNVRVVDVFGGGILKCPVSIVDGHFAGFAEVEAREVVDGHGRFMVPGLMDGHVHVESSMLTPARFADMVAPCGTTAIISDPHELANVFGAQAITYMLDVAAMLPIDMRIMLPSCVPATPFEDAGSLLMAADIAPFIDHLRVSGVAEIMNFPGVICNVPDVADKIALGEGRGKMVDGHSPGLAGQDLDAYAAAGVRSDHECTTVEELRDRLARGMYVHLRQGSAARNLATLLPGVPLAGLRRCLFCSDDVHPETLVSEGHMNRHLRLAVASGLDPVLAIIMATLNVAECYKLNKGAIAPGREADFVLMGDLKDFVAHKVYVAGKLIAEQGHMLRATECSVPDTMLHSMHLAPLSDTAFELPVPSGRARVMGIQPATLVTRHLERDVRTDNRGMFDPAANAGLNLLAVIERHHATGSIGLGLIEGYGLSGGAIASTVAHDTHNLVVAGDNAADMRLAVATVQEQGGGLAMCAGGAVIGHLPLPVGGIMTTSTAAEVHAVLVEMTRTAREQLLIPANIDPFMMLSFMALPVIPELKLTARGLFDVQSFSFIPVNME